MKKILLLSVCSLVIIASCKKSEDNPSTVVTASFPKINLEQKYYSIPVGAVRPVVQATAYDSFYKESEKIVTVDSTINNFVPGFYYGTISAQNKYGFVSIDTYYVAVTNVASSMDLSGHWIQFPSNDSFSTNITKLANGLYSSNNVDGVNFFLNTAGVIQDYFVVTSNTSFMFTSSGTVGTLSYVPLPGVSTMTYTSSTGGTLIFSR